MLKNEYHWNLPRLIKNWDLESLDCLQLLRLLQLPVAPVTPVAPVERDWTGLYQGSLRTENLSHWIVSSYSGYSSYSSYQLHQLLQ